MMIKAVRLKPDKAVSSTTLGLERKELVLSAAKAL